MDLHLEPEEAAVLAQVVANRVSELRSEVVHTDQYDLRQALKRDEVLLRALMARLQSLLSGGGAAGAAPSGLARAG